MLAGFQWQLLFNVEKAVTSGDTAVEGDVLAGATAMSGAMAEFVGVRCHANVGNNDYWPRVVRFKATIAALQVRCVAVVQVLHLLSSLTLQPTACV